MRAAIERDGIQEKHRREAMRQKMPSDSVPLRDSVPRRFGARVRWFVQTQSLQQFLFEKTLAM